MAHYPRTHYARVLNEDYRWPLLSASIETETCVVGGGLAGVATALALAERGRSVALVEAKRVGWGASGRNGGIASRGYPISMDAVADRVGRESAKELWRLSSEALELVKRRARAIGSEIVREKGVLRCRMKGHADVLAAYVERMNTAFDAGLVHISHANLHELIESESYSDAYLNPSSFQIDPLAFTRGLAHLASSNGAQLFEDSSVRKVRRAGRDWLVQTNTGAVKSQNVVFAGGAYLGLLHKRLGLATVPVSTFVMATKPAPEIVGRSIRTDCAVLDTRVATNYYRVLSDGRLLWGGRASSVEWKPDKLARLLRQDMIDIHPEFSKLDIDIAWSGRMPIARHRMPVVGKIGDGLWSASCFAGLGLVTTSLAGELIGAAIAERDDRVRLFEPFGLPFSAGALGKVGFQIVYWKHTAHDWLLGARPVSRKIARPAA